MIDVSILADLTGNKADYWYICGPDAFTAAMVGHLEKLGIATEQIVIEQ